MSTLKCLGHLRRDADALQTSEAIINIGLVKFKQVIN